MQEIFSAMFDGKLQILEQVGFEITDKKMCSYYLYKIQDRIEIIIRVIKNEDIEVDIYFTPQDVEKLRDFVNVQGSQLESKVTLSLTYCKVHPRVCKNSQFYGFCTKENENRSLGMVISSLNNWFFEHEKCMRKMLKAKRDAEEESGAECFASADKLRL